MSIVSLQFALFVLTALAVFHLLRGEAKTHWLLLVSYAFYALCSARFLPVLVFITVSNFWIAGRLLDGHPRRRFWLWTGLAMDVGALALLRLVYRDEPFAGPFVVVGISFYALQAMSYLLDLNAGTLPHRGTLRDLALYLAYFPKLVAGPIERAKSFLPQLLAPKPVSDETLARAFTLILVGVMRKVVIADPLRAMLPDDVFSEPAHFGTATLVVSLIGYSFALYNDFAGYTSIVRGVSSLFGIELSANFAQPFFARSFTEFWNRWHMTLSFWLRDYAYLPLSRALLRRNPRLRNVSNIVLPPMAAMLGSGLWHGLALHTLLWGTLHGLYLIAERALSLWWPGPPIRSRPLWRQVAAAGLVFFLGTWALVAFRMETPIAAAFWSRLVLPATGMAPSAWFGFFFALSLTMDALQYHGGEVAVFLQRPRSVRVVLAVAAVIACIVMRQAHAPAPFVYQGF